MDVAPVEALGMAEASIRDDKGLGTKLDALFSVPMFDDDDSDDALIGP